MRLYEVIWKEQYIEKIDAKHGVDTDEVEQVLFGNPHVRRVEKGKVKGEDVFAAYGRTNAGRYLIVFFINKRKTTALPISARDMSGAERNYYEKQKEAH